MDYIATLLTNNPADIAAFKAGRSVVREDWKKEGAAYEVVFSSPNPQCLMPNASFDLLVEPYPPAPKKLLISDMDSTMIGQECIDELADFVGKKAQVSAITERAMNGELVFEEALRERVALLKGLPVDVLGQCFEQKITLMPGARELLRAFKMQGGNHLYPDRPAGVEGYPSVSGRSLDFARDKRGGGTAVLVSGGFTFFTERVAALLGFDEDFANVLDVKDGHLTGTVQEPILGKEAKLAQLERQCELLGIGPENVIAIGDGANDLPMLKAAGLGIAYRAKPVVAAQVASRITQGDLSGILYALTS